jgi:hypothetical protein
MIWQRVNRSDPEKIFIVVQNVHAGTMTAGYSCVWDISAPDGVRVSQAVTATLGAYAGIADADIAQNAYGLIQVYGYRTSAYLYSSTGTSAAGDILIPSNAEWGLEPYTYAQTTTKGFGFLAETLTASASSRFHTTKKVFVRALG